MSKCKKKCDHEVFTVKALLEAIQDVVNDGYDLSKVFIGVCLDGRYEYCNHLELRSNDDRSTSAMVFHYDEE